jgi:tetratricopeptide (TPR) repeat protein
LWECVLSGTGTADEAYDLSLTYRELKNYDSGLARTNAALQQLPDNIDLLFLTAFLHYRRAENKDSMILLSKAYKVDAKDWRIHQLLALNYISFGMLEAAKLSLRQAIALNPRNAELRYQLARLYFELGSYVESIQASEQALAIVPEYPEVYHNLALCYEGNGNVELATANFEKAIELNRKYKRKDEWPLVDYAIYQRMRGLPDASLPLLKEALTINARSPKANFEMGVLLHDLKRDEEARKYLETAVSLDPCNARAIYELAVLTRLVGDSERADALLKRFKEVNVPASQGTVEAGRCEPAEGQAR